MLEISDFQILDNITLKDNKLDSIFQSLFEKIESYLDLPPYITKIQIKILSEKYSENKESKDIFSVGVNRYKVGDILAIAIYEDFIEFIMFILLREIYNCFIPNKLRKNEYIQITVNQIILTHLNKSPLLNDWIYLIRKNIEDYDSLSKGVNRLDGFDRLGKLFKFNSLKILYDPIQFFFRYLRNYTSLISEKMENLPEIIFEEFSNYISQSLNNDEMVETIRCIIKIFYKVQNYENLRTYQKYFKDFKENNEIETSLSLSKFIKNMDWVKKYSFIAPSYQLNWNAINVVLLSIFLKFNPILNIQQIYKIIAQFPFFISPKISRNSFAIDISGYIVIPRVYLDDFIGFIRKLEDFGYTIKQYCLLFNSNENFLNLNYFRAHSKYHRIVNPDHSEYKRKYEIECKTYYKHQKNSNELSFLDFLVLDRIRFFSISGFGFERRKEGINSLKTDLVNTIITERAKIKKLKNVLNVFYNSAELKTDILKFLEVNRSFGFFYIKSMLEEYLSLLKLIEDVLNDQPNILNYSMLKETIENPQNSYLDKKILNSYDKKVIDVIFKEFLPVFFKSRDIYLKKVEKLRLYYDLINSCYQMKIFNLNSIKQILMKPQVIKTIYRTKEEKLKQYFEKYKPYKLTSREIESILDKLLHNNPPIIQPLLINTITTDLFVNDYLQLILTKSSESLKFVEKIKVYFPRALINDTKELISNKSLIYVEIYTPYMTKNEKEQFYSMLYSNCQHNIVYAKSYLWSGKIQALSRKNFYDFNTNQFFYTKDLYEQFFLYVQKLLGKPLKIKKERENRFQEKFWSSECDISKLLREMNYHDEIEKVDVNAANLNKLLNFERSLKEYLLDDIKFEEFKRGKIFNKYIKSIKFVPAFQHFGMEQFFLYLYPRDITELDFKILLTNTFQEIEYPTCIDTSNSFLIRYIMPYRFPTLKYVHWLTKAKKIIREYCAFSIKRMHRILHFDYNLSSNGWEYNKDRFKVYMEKILFNPNYKIKIPEIKTFNIRDKADSKHFTPKSTEYKDLSQLYNVDSIDLKTYLGSNKYVKIDQITNLLKQDIIFPYITFKNLGLQKEIKIILPNIKKELNTTFLKVFSFFNIGFIYEIEGELYIDGFLQEKKFENGLMIKLYLPKCEIHEFLGLFELLFQYLGIKHYLILHDLVDGTNLIESIFGNLDFLKEYNPLTNLKWNPKDKIWMNHKLFTEKFEKIYPDLIFREGSCQRSDKN